jgi:DNA replication and repair protein RecF
MFLSRILLTNYRNFRHMELRMPAGLVFILGDNGAGKTNLLEAAYILSIAKSYRTNVERELINWHAQKQWDSTIPISDLNYNQTIIDGEVEQQRGKLRIIIELRVASDGNSGGKLVKKQVRANGRTVTVGGLVGLINAVLFTASDIELAHGPPARRRRFLDILISQVDRKYMASLQRYQRVLSQRNHLLRLIRAGRSTSNELYFWDTEIIKEGSLLTSRRQDVVEKLKPVVARKYNRLGGADGLSVSLQRSVQEGELERTIASHRSADIKAGMTTAGPHRDDLSLTLNGNVPANYSSRGQGRIIAFALRLAEAEFLKEERLEEPILLLDDVLSELDSQRRHSVLQEASEYQQALVTTAEPWLIHDAPVDPSTIVRMQSGKAESATLQ